MNAELKAKWVEALRSGKYKQGTGTLRRSGTDADTFCCLGVLCDILAPNDWLPPAPWHQGSAYQTSGEPAVYMPKSMAEASGLLIEVQGKLVQMNDGAVCSFSEIASYIETNL